MMAFVECMPPAAAHTEVAFPQRRAGWLAVRPLTISLNGSGFSEQQVRRAHKYVPDPRCLNVADTSAAIGSSVL